MAGNTCLPSIDGCALRVARLAADGTTPAGATNGYITKGFVRVNLDPQFDEGDETKLRNACGDLAINTKDEPVMTHVNVELELTTPDPELYELLTGGSLITTTGDSTGFAFPPLGEVVAGYYGVSLEVWTKRINPDGSQPADGSPYYRWPIPSVKFRIGARPIQRGPMTHAFTGKAIENASWGNGPANDWLATPSGRVVSYDIDDTIPTPACGYWTVPVQT